MPPGRPKGSINTSKNKYINGVEKHKPKSKINAPPKDINESKIYYCTSCGKDFPKLYGNFRASQSPFFKGWGYIPVCLKCLDYFEEQYTERLGSNDEAIKRLALHFDLYLNDSILNASKKVNVGQSRIAQYISSANCYFSRKMKEEKEENNEKNEYAHKKEENKRQKA